MFLNEVLTPAPKAKSGENEDLDRIDKRGIKKLTPTSIIGVAGGVSEEMKSEKLERVRNFLKEQGMVSLVLENDSHHCTKNTCPLCESVQTCRCRTEKVNETQNICYNCSHDDTLNEAKGHKESMKDRIEKKYKIDKFQAGSIGYSSESKKWYGWSHRCICGFAVGDKIDSDDHILVGTDGFKVGFEAKTEDDCKRMAQAVSKATG
jgi:hypothetical protein